jgi:hypothetical protein
MTHTTQAQTARENTFDALLVNSISQDSVPTDPIAHAASELIVLFVQNDTHLNKSSPKPELPAPEDYMLPPAPQSRELGPPPPGFARFADFDRPGGPGPAMGGGGGGGSMSNQLQRRNLDEVTCFKV